MQYMLTWRNKYLTSEAKTVGEMAQALEEKARQLRDMEQDGFLLDPESSVEDDYALLATDDLEVARKYGFEDKAAPVVPEVVNMNDETIHKQVWVEWKGEGAYVDEELAPLILALWQAGIDTMMSCQENRPGIAWLCFPTPLDAKMFLDLVAAYPDEDDVPFSETLYGRIAGCGSDGDWEYAVNVCDLGVEEDIVHGEVIQTCIGPSDFMFDVSVRFPRTDLPLVLESFPLIFLAFFIGFSSYD